MQKLQIFTTLLCGLTLSWSSPVFAVWRPFSCQTQLMNIKNEVISKTEQNLGNRGPLESTIQLDTEKLELPEISIFLRPALNTSGIVHFLEVYHHTVLIGRSSFVYTQGRVDLTVSLPQNPSENSLLLSAECHLEKSPLYGPL